MNHILVALLAFAFSVCSFAGSLSMDFGFSGAVAESRVRSQQQSVNGARGGGDATDGKQEKLQKAVRGESKRKANARSKVCRRAALHLAKVLEENQKREDITPDSFYHDWRNLNAEMLREKDPTAKAIYRAALAHLLCQNKWRSQTYERQTESHLDSIQEWTFQEYQAHAAKLYAQALQDAEALYLCQLADAVPLAQKGKDDNIFGGNLLSLVWKTYRQDLPTLRGEQLVPNYSDIIALYHRYGNREAALMLRLDEMKESSIYGTNPTREEALLQLREQYADLDACAGVYIMLADLPSKTNTERYDLLQTALKRYPKSCQANELKNRLISLRWPHLSAKFCERCYPNRDYSIPLEIKNMQTANIAIYSVPLDFQFSDKPKADSKLKQLQAQGKCIETLPISTGGTESFEVKHDTLCWHTPSYGKYAIVLDGTTKEKLQKGYEPQIVLVNVTSLSFMSATLPNGRERIMVVDAMTGKPQQGVRVSVFRQRQLQKSELISEQTTDKHGIVEIQAKDKNYLYAELSRGEDIAFGRTALNWYDFPERKEGIRQNIKIYTDRAIYRPGQTVYIGAIAYTQSHEQAPRVEAGKDYTLTLKDANGQVVAEHKLTTDEFGTLQDSMLLPKTGLPGNYLLSIDKHTHRIRVEEYRRPTFKVEMDEMPALSLPLDSVRMTGRAVTYSQWPIANARVTSTFRWQQSWWYKRLEQGTLQQIDTLYTDEEGRFSISVPVSGQLTEQQLQWGQTLLVNIDVLSIEGETQHGSCRLTLCSEPLRLKGAIPEQENQESLTPWRFDLYASNDKTIDGEVVCTLSQGGKVVQNFTILSGKDTIPDALRGLPSGKYDLYATANAQGDTASYRASFTIFSITDKRLQGEHALWLYTPCDTFAVGQPALFQVGTSLPEAWVYCLMTGECGVVKDTLLHLSNQAMLFEVPYEERFRHHLAVTLMLMHEGQPLQKGIDFKLRPKDTNLRMRWDTFRNHLHPGQREQWRLTLTQPDGSPASANVILAMYDASLNALSPYDLNLYVDRSCSRNVFLRTNLYDWFSRGRYCSLALPLYYYPDEGYEFARWNDLYFQSISTTRGIRQPMRLGRVTSNAVVQDMQVAPKVKMEAKSAECVEEVAKEEEEAVYVRTNLSELAFFSPRLRTDGKGQTSIEFTLPEGLTSWHLHGLAHTKEMMTTTWQEMVVARKELMAELTLPRFLRNGDEALLVASVRNASEKQQKGEAILEVLDAESEAELKKMKVEFELEPGKEAVYHMPIQANQECSVLAVRWVASAAESSDGEMRYLPVLSDMQNVVQTKTYVLSGDTAMTMNLSEFFAKEAVNKTLTIEYVSEPLYFALQALPSLVSPARKDVLSVASAYYGGSVAHHIAQAYPWVREAIDAWCNEENAEALESPLTDNQQLADILLNETPWVAEAQRQKLSRQRLTSLFDEVEQEQGRMSLLTALAARQHADGSFGWFPGMRGSTWMTSEVAMQLVRLGLVRGIWTTPERQVLDKAIAFLEKDMSKVVQRLRKEKKPQLSLHELRYLYIYIMYGKVLNADAEYLLSLLKKQATSLDREPRALAAIVLKRVGEEKKAQALMPRLCELLTHADGMYLAHPSGSFVSIDRKVESHVCLMEAFSQVEPTDTKLLVRMAEWLLRQKQTQEWEQPVQSADAIYALLKALPRTISADVENHNSWKATLAYDNQTRSIQATKPYAVSVREQVTDIDKAESFHISQHASENTSSWGAIYAQCQMPVAAVECSSEGMTIRREVLGKSEALDKGSRIHVRYTITAERDYEYVCLKAPRPAAAEPASQPSGYCSQSGLGYYVAMHDASTEYFLDSLPRGTYVIEEDWIMGGGGSYLLPPARLTCLYAPAFQSHTEGAKIEVK